MERTTYFQEEDQPRFTYTKVIPYYVNEEVGTLHFYEVIKTEDSTQKNLIAANILEKDPSIIYTSARTIINMSGGAFIRGESAEESSAVSMSKDDTKLFNNPLMNRVLRKIIYDDLSFRWADGDTLY
jgi:hypothetical protein